MCIIAVKKRGCDLPLKKYLENSYENNSDGVGIALLNSNINKVYIKKDFKDFNIFHAWLKRNINKNDFLVIHFRMATSGKTDKGNRHPFPITRNISKLRATRLYTDFAVVHNGILPEYSTSKKLSDTQVFTKKVLYPMKNKLSRKKIINRICKKTGTDKLVIINATNSSYWLLGDFTKDENGILWSNDGYKHKTTYYYINNLPLGFDSYYSLDKKNWETRDNDYIPFDKKHKGTCDLCLRYELVEFDEVFNLHLCKICQDECYEEDYNDEELRGKQLENSLY